MSARNIRLVLVDDHALVRDGMRALLSMMPSIDIVGEAESGAGSLALLCQVQADVLLLDIGLKDTNGLELTRQLGVLYPEVRVLLLSMYDNTEYVRSSIRAGACGYVLKEASAREIIAAVEAVAAGGTFYSPAIIRKLAEAEVGATSSGDSLTPREHQVLQMLARGLDSKGMARELVISVRTVEAHRLSIRRKLKISSAAELIRYALSMTPAEL